MQTTVIYFDMYLYPEFRMSGNCDDANIRWHTEHFKCFIHIYELSKFDCPLNLNRKIILNKNRVKYIVELGSMTRYQSIDATQYKIKNKIPSEPIHLTANQFDSLRLQIKHTICLHNAAEITVG